MTHPRIYVSRCSECHDTGIDVHALSPEPRPCPSCKASPEKRSDTEGPEDQEGTVETSQGAHRAGNSTRPHTERSVG